MYVLFVCVVFLSHRLVVCVLGENVRVWWCRNRCRQDKVEGGSVKRA